MFSDRKADGDLLFTFSSDILDFRKSLSSYLKFGSPHEYLSRFLSQLCSQLGGLATRKARSACFLTSLSAVKLVSEVNLWQVKSSSPGHICSRSSGKRAKDMNKNATSTMN